MATILITVHCKLFQVMPYIIILKVRKFHRPTANLFSTAKKKLVGGYNVAPPPPSSLNGVEGRVLRIPNIYDLIREIFKSHKNIDTLKKFRENCCCSYFCKIQICRKTNYAGCLKKLTILKSHISCVHKSLFYLHKSQYPMIFCGSLCHKYSCDM